MDEIICYGCGKQLPGFKLECPDCGAKLGKALVKDPGTMPKQLTVCAFFDRGTCHWARWRQKEGDGMLEQARRQAATRVPGGQERFERVERALKLVPSECTHRGMTGGWHYCTASKPDAGTIQHIPDLKQQWSCTMYQPASNQREPTLGLRLYAALADAPEFQHPSTPAVVEGSSVKPVLTVLSANSLAEVGGGSHEAVEQQLVLFQEHIAKSDSLANRVDIRYSLVIQPGAMKREELYNFVADSKLVLVWVTPELLAERDCMNLLAIAEDLQRRNAVTTMCVLARDTDWQGARSFALFGLFQLFWLPRNHMALSAQPDQGEAMDRVVDELLAFFP